MLQATVLGSGLSPGHVLHARASTRAQDALFPVPDSPSVHLLAQPRYLLPSSHSSSSSPSSISAGPSALPNLKHGIPDGDESLTWCAREVTWSRGAVVVRRFTYEHEQTDIACAAFAWFEDVASSTGSGKRSDSGRASGSMSRTSSSTSQPLPPPLPAAPADPTFGPFHTSQRASWSPQPRPREGQKGTSRVVVVILQTRAHIYFSSGEDVIVHLPFTVDACWALPTGGLLVQRALEPRETRAGASAGQARRAAPRASMFDRTAMSVLDDLDEVPDTPLPRLYTLTERYGELKAVVQAPIRHLGDVPRLAPNVPTIPISPSQSVLHVSPDPYPFVVVYDRAEGQIIFYRRAIVPLEVDDPLPPVSTLRPDELLRQAEMPMPPGPRRGRASLNRSVAAERRVSIVGPDPLDRTRRRTSRLSAANDEEFDLPAFSGEGGPRTSRGGSGEASKKAKAPRLSGITKRDEPFEFGKTALAVVAEDLRETTMMMGLEREDVERSELVFERIWSWRPPSPTKPAAARVFISENRSDDFVLLNLVLTMDHYATTMFVFHVSKSNWRYVFSELRAVQCLAAQPVIATRPNVYDTIVLTPEGPRLLWASGHETQVQIPRVPTIDGRDEVARQLASSLSMVLDGDGATLSKRSVVDLVDPSGSRVTAVYNDGERVRVSFDFALPPGLPRRALEALSYALSPEEYVELSEAYLGELQSKPAAERGELGLQWETLAEVLCVKCGLPPSAPTSARDKMLAAWSTQSDPTLRLLAQRVQALNPRATARPQRAMPATSTPRALLALHLVAQDCRLSCTAEPELSLIAPVIARLATSIGRADWVDCWRRLMPTALIGIPGGDVTGSVQPSTSCLDNYDEPPDVLQYLARRLTSPTMPFPLPQTCFDQTSPLGTPSPCARTELLMAIYSRMTQIDTRRSRTSERALAVTTFMVDSGLDAAWMADVPPCVVIPVREMIRVCQLKPPKQGSAALFKFIGREDLAAMYLEHSAVDLPMGAEEGPEEPPTVAQLMTADKGNKHSHFAALPHVRFGLDRRLDEVDRIMQTTRQRTISVDSPKGANEADIQMYHQSVVNTIAHRTLAVTVGQGMFMYGSRTAPITEAWTIPLIELSAKVVPGNTVLKAQLPDGAEWPCFHNGVSAALSISPECQGITASWIAFNRPSPLSAEHGGFLLGLGLMGHLRLIDSTHAFSYLEPRHDMTSVGLLLGIGCSFAGSRDLMVTKVLSLHTHALLPMGAMELNQSTLVQSAALVSLGLVYAGSKNLRMAEMALAEIARDDMPAVEGFYEHREAYSFSSAMSFGLIMLGRGGAQTSEVERKMLQQLTLLIHGDAPDVMWQGKRKANSIDSTITSPGATLALGFMYLKTGRKDIADMLKIPQTALELESVRPDQLLIRTFARALIMWDDVKGTPEWVDAQLPPFIHELHNGHKRTNGMELNTELAYLNVIAGACLGLGIRYASAANEAVHHVIITFFSVLAKAAAGQSMTYEGKIRRNAARQALNIVTLAAAVQMSGTGELNVTRRLRVSHGQEGAGVSYGSHMAMHMALGLLYLGRGYFTLGNSNLAIAAMSIAFFPRFLPSPGDNRAYPQAFRHLWALAVEPRCLIARDVDTRKSIFLPIKVKVRGKAGDNQLISPTLVAPFESIESITIDSPRYWPIAYDLNVARDREALVRTRTIWVKRKSGFLDYSADPRGFRSMFVRAGTMSGFDMHYDLVSAAAPLALPAADVIDLISSHTDDPVFVTLAQRFAGDSWLESFVRCVLFECLSLDKPGMLTVYFAMALGLQANDDLALQRLAQVSFLHRFYSTGVYDRLCAGVSGDKRHPILRQTFVQSAARRLAAGDAVGTPSGGGSSGTSAVTGATSTALMAVRREYFNGGSADWFTLAGQAGLSRADAAALAVYLARNHVPPVRLLESLRQLVSRADAPAGVGAQHVLEVKVREAAERYAAAVVRAYDDNGGAEDGVAGRTPEGGLWKLESLREALDVWQE